MKFIKVVMALIIAGSMAFTTVALVKVIGVQKGMGDKQDALLAEVERQNKAVQDILPAFEPTEEMVAKTEAMLADLQSLVAVVSDMNELVAQANSLQGTTALLIDQSNMAINGLSREVSAAKAPLDAVGDRTSLTLGYIEMTVAALQEMAAGLASSNSYASDLADMMEGKF